MTKNVNISQKNSFAFRIKDYIALGKLRLSSLVVFSAIIGYLIAPGPFNLISLVFLICGGFLVTAASNAFNQIWERNSDSKMDRTKDRPVASGRISILEGIVFATLIGAFGEFCLFQLNFLSGVLGLLAMLLYVLIYTPLKPISPIAVFVGAFPGSIPPLLGYVAVTGDFGLIPGVLFMTQFFWQFPHFWSIAWKLDDDYRKAGFKMLPSKGGRNKSSAFQVFIYSAAMIPIGMLPWLIDLSGNISMLFVALLGILLTIPAYKLYKSLEMKYAKQLMFASFLYLPLAQLAYLLDKL